MPSFQYKIWCAVERLQKAIFLGEWEQKQVFDSIVESVTNNRGGLYFLYSHRGIGKTFVWKILLMTILAKGEIVINVTFSGIVALLLRGGRIAYPILVVPLNINENSTCSIK